MRLIDKDALIKSMKSHTVEDNGLTNDYKAGLTDSIRAAVALAENASTIDALPVVRCKDCKHYQTDVLFNSNYCCGRRRKPDDYCSYGERKESEGGT